MTPLFLVFTTLTMSSAYLLRTYTLHLMVLRQKLRSWACSLHMFTHTHPHMQLLQQVSPRPSDVNASSAHNNARKNRSMDFVPGNLYMLIVIMCSYMYIDSWMHVKVSDISNTCSSLYPNHKAQSGVNQKTKRFIHFCHHIKAEC